MNALNLGTRMANIDQHTPVSVGAVLKGHLINADGITQDKLAKAIKVSRHSVNELINDRRSITAQMALRLARAFSTTPEFWIKLQMQRDLEIARAELGIELKTIRVLRQPQTVSDVTVPLNGLFE